ncbi:hypothetical protein LJC34_07725 [Oscillospiraceae bacterium OttesenSCG-928-G22]|nr:hypothetical protein [Oscillospiraceae bacterium OttesenSCG-928-G22]
MSQYILYTKLKNGVVLWTVMTVLSAWMTLLSLPMLSEPNRYGAMPLLFSGFLVWFLVFSIRRMNLMRRGRRYADILTVDPNHSLIAVAAAVRRDLSLVEKDVLRLGKKGIFPLAFYAPETHCFVLSGAGSQAAAPGTPPWAPDSRTATRMLRVTCWKCGRPQVLEQGKPSPCPDCGALIGFENQMEETR